VIRLPVSSSAAALSFAAALFALFPMASNLSAQSRVKELAAGKLLVADRSLRDPNFAETVILLVQHDEANGSVGLALNRRTNVPLSRVFRYIEKASSRKDTVYLGGPVERADIFLLLRSRTHVEGARPIFDDVYITSSQDVLEKQIQSNADVKRFHAYMGYAGWADGQLEQEIAIGAWHVLPADSAPIFDSDPDTLWSRLTQKTELHIAAAYGAASFPFSLK
jgi:putative transcriptional regulator